MATFKKGMYSCCIRENNGINGKEDKLFWEEIKDFPSSFHMKDQEQLGPNIMKRLQNGLESSISVGYKTTLETARAHNLMAYLLFRQRQPSEALEHIQFVLATEDQHENIVSLANKVIILWKMGFDSEYKQQLRVLQDLKLKGDNFIYLVIKAKAELAFSYTRFGPKFFSTAIAAFEEILPQAKETEKPLWTFGMALTLRRAMHLQFTPRTESLADVSARNYRILSLLQEVVDGSNLSLRAKAYAEMGLLLNNSRRDVALHRAAGVKTAAEACEKALELDDADNSVLVKSSRIFRYSKYKLEYCLELLLKADSFRHSSTAYHHIALTYKAMQTSKKYCCSNDFIQGYDLRGRPNSRIGRYKGEIRNIRDTFVGRGWNKRRNFQHWSFKERRMDKERWNGFGARDSVRLINTDARVHQNEHYDCLDQKRCYSQMVAKQNNTSNRYQGQESLHSSSDNLFLTPSNDSIFREESNDPFNLLKTGNELEKIQHTFVC